MLKLKRRYKFNCRTFVRCDERCFKFVGPNNFNGKRKKISVEDINECLGLINFKYFVFFFKVTSEKQSVSAIENYRNLVKTGKLRTIS